MTARIDKTTLDALLARIGSRRVVASVSGGKDSAAMSLYLTELGIEHVRVFANTGWEAKWTYEYLRGPLTEKLGPIVEVAAVQDRSVLEAARLFAAKVNHDLGTVPEIATLSKEGAWTFQDLVRHKRIFPDRTKRFCTVELKVKPIKAYIDSLDCDAVNAIGVRREEESEARRKVPEWETSESLDVEVWRPIASWTKDDVIAIHKRHGLAPNPLYAMGAIRVGCWPCIYARQSEIALVADKDPDRIAEIDALEREVTDAARAKAEAKGEDLDWIRAMFSIRESKATPGPDGEVRRRHVPLPIYDAVKWARAGLARRTDAQTDLFPASCGEWGFCEGGS